MITIFQSFSVRADPVTVPTKSAQIFTAFSVQRSEQKEPTSTAVICREFCAGVAVVHTPVGAPEICRSFGLAPSGVDVFGTPMPDHIESKAYLLRIKANR